MVVSNFVKRTTHMFALAAAGALALVATPAQAQPTLVARPLAPLKTVKVPLPSNLNDFVQDRQAAIALGKALFWDMQAGSDGLTACATCHYHAGTDARIENTLGLPNDNPHDISLRSTVTKLTERDFPFVRVDDPNSNDDASAPARRSTRIAKRWLVQRASSDGISCE